MKKDISHNTETCDFCGICVAVCPDGAVRIDLHNFERDRSRCTLCLKCTKACPVGALSPAEGCHEAEL